MPWSSMEGVPASLKGIRPAITLEQANTIASIADGLSNVESPWAVAIATFKKGHVVKDGAWVKRETSPVSEAAQDWTIADLEQYDEAKHKGRTRFFMAYGWEDNGVMADGFKEIDEELTPEDIALAADELWVLKSE